eukprot:CAMPEP_0114437164 /NCGR_PEP_ID=MMETSP0103-20121206/13859_1 /TAXON_ID=37642 ORGANISM="Paraphysomonas imperforata, Strain PA2" /NCGR_SAMPLE_ID=MMETSP0103 /ASSEMBLY_ACC=CAM_ASM_000201 /LENGTH=276 /DNA_ID=CAMNT_0001607521 /DNA_START=181 /DNA_END=1011 /DNA_ORIENTATION=+
MGIALRLAQARASVTIVGRNQNRGQEIVQQMQQLASAAASTTSEPSLTPQFSFMQCDASLMKNIQTCVNDYKANNESLDILVLTQGIASMNGYTPTSEGIEQKLAIHYYGRVLFTKLLLPLLAASPDARVMSVLSAGVHAPYSLYKTDPDLEKNFSIKNGADSAGFYNDIAMAKLAAENEKVSFFHTCPGFVGSAWGSEFAWYLKGPIRLLQATFATSVQDCAEYHFRSLVSSECAGGGAHYMNQRGEPTTVTKLQEEAADTVWAHTQEVIQQRLE